MKTIDQFNFKDKKAIIRVDYNVPLNDTFQITNDNRITASLPTIRKILTDGGSAILMSHLGRPKGGFEEKFSLKHLVAHLSDLLKLNVHFSPDMHRGRRHPYGI
jgi:phosphoglycerate kinase